MRHYFRNNWIDIIFLVFFLICAVVLFYSEINAVDPITEREKGLFSATEFGLAIGIGWLFQRIASKEEYQRSLKQYALSAYRRINDLNKSIMRLDDEIARMRATYPKEKMHELDLLGSIAEVMNFTVQSSIADWSDVIGPEVRILKEIEEKQYSLENAKSYLSKKSLQTSEDPDKLLELYNSLLEQTDELKKLRSELPLSLQYSISSGGSNTVIQLLEQHYFNNFFNYGKVILSCSNYSYKHDDKKILEKGREVSLFIDHGTGGQYLLAVEDSEYGVLGNIENEFGHLGIDDQIYSASLLKILRDRIETIGRDRFPAKVEDDYRSRLIISVPARKDQLQGWG